MNTRYHKYGSIAFVALLGALLARPYLLERWNDYDANKIRQSGLKVQEVSREIGVNFLHRMPSLDHDLPNWPWLEGVGAAVAVSDVNEDGFQDIYFNSSDPKSPSALFINQKDGTFKEDAARFGLNFIPALTVRPVFFDCDNDGHQELLIFSSEYPAIYKKDANGKFRLHDQIIGNRSCFGTGAGSVVDLNGDGYLDIIYGGESDSANPRGYNPFNMTNTTNGSNVTVYRNDGHCRFKEDPGRIPIAQKLFYNAVGVGDFRNQNKKDLWFAVEFNEDRPVLADDNQRYQNATRAKKEVNAYSGMNADVAYLDPFIPSIFVTHVFKSGFLTAGNALWKYAEGSFHNEATSVGLHECGWSWGGKFFDMDNDGGLDLAVVNGFYTGPKKQEYWFTFASLAATSRSVTYQSNRWPPMGQKSLSGNEADCLYLNQGGHFAKVPTDLGFDPDRLDGRGVATIDARNDGNLDLVVANHKGRAYYYRLAPAHRGHWIGFDLKGSGFTEVGAKVRIRSDGGIQTREAYSTNTFASQNDPRLHFGLGADEIVKEVEIWWPSGKYQKLSDLVAGRYYQVQEP